MKVLFTGLGSIGRRHLKNFRQLCEEQNTKAEVTALRSSDVPLEDEVRKLVDIETRTLAPNACFDIAFITGPTHLHKEMIAGLKGRVDTFFIEKPIFHKTDVDLAAIGLGSEQKAYVAAPMRWTETYHALRQYLNAVAPYAARCICSSYLPGWRPGVDYRNSYSAHADMGGGVALDLIHEWDYLVDLFGMPDISYCIKGHFSQLEINSDDLAIYIARYPHFCCELHLDYFGKQERRSLEVFTAEGSILADFIEGSLTLPSGGLQLYKEHPNQRYLREMAYFLSYAQGGEFGNANSPQRALQILKIVQGDPVWQAD